ncbi:MAG: NmrA family NAD(P)-binding protein [Phycisphaerales bacterium]
MPTQPIDFHRTPSDAPVLVTAASGKTGRRIADGLTAHGVSVRRGSRRGQTPFDWDAPRTWAAALEGAWAATISFVPDLAVPSAAPAIAAFVDAAAHAGVQRLVLLSGRGEPGAQACERIVLDGPIDATVVRASWFNQNFSEGPFADMIRAGVIALPGGDVPEPFIDADDIAEVMIAALLEDRHIGTVHEVTGPELLTLSEVAALFTRAGHPVAYTPISVQDFERTLLDRGAPAPYAAMLCDLITMGSDGRNARLANGIEDALGRPARSIHQFIDRHVAGGTWSRSAMEVPHG